MASEAEILRSSEGFISGDTLICAAHRAELFIGIGRISGAGPAALRRRWGNPYQFIRMRKWQRAQKNRIDDAEDCDIRADGESENQKRDGGEPRVAAKRAEGVANVMQQVVPVISDASAPFVLLTDLLTNALHCPKVAELAQGFFARRVRRQALADQIVRLGFEMEAKFVFYISGGIRAEEARITAPERCRWSSGLLRFGQLSCGQHLWRLLAA